MRDYKLVVLGAGGVGKSCLTVQFVQGVYLDSYDPTIEDSYRKTMEIDNKVFDLEILDTAGVAQFTAMRELYIKSGMGFLLVYSVSDRQSLNELLELREQVLRIKDSDRVPIVLVGNKADLQEERVIPVEEGIEVSSKWGRVPFYETSALLRSNVDEVFVDLVRQIIRNELESASSSGAGAQSRNFSQAQRTIQQGGGGGGITDGSNGDAGERPDEGLGVGMNNSSSGGAPLKKNDIAGPSQVPRQAGARNARPMESDRRGKKSKKNKNKKKSKSCVIL